MADIREALNVYVKRVRELHEHVRGNEQATKQSIVGPLLSLLGYDLTDPRECIPEYRTDFGPNRSAKPIDWAFFANGRPIFFVEAKEVGKRLSAYSEQLGDYFAKSQDVKLGILTNGVQWRFYTDAVHSNIMDKEPFATWDILADENPPYDVLTVLQKSQYNAEILRAFAQRQLHENLLVSELAKLLEPSPEFMRLAISNIETRRLTDGVLESWKPIVANAIHAWARQRTLQSVLNAPANSPSAEAEERSKIETTQEELDAFKIIKECLGTERPVDFEDTINYFKVHLPGQSFWAVCRLYLGKRVKQFSVPLVAEKIKELGPGFEVEEGGRGWNYITIDSIDDFRTLAPVLRAAWDSQKASRGKEVESPANSE